MTDAQLAELSRILFSPVTLSLYTGAMLLYLWVASARLQPAGGDAAVRRAPRVRLFAAVLTGAGIAAHVAHVIVRTLAAGRAPLGNMFEFTVIGALVLIVGGLVVLRRRQRSELMGFVLLGTVLTLASALLVYNEPGPLMPILDSWWRGIHVTAIVFAFGLFTTGFVFTSLYLLRDTAEARVAETQTARRSGSTVGAAYLDTGTTGDEDTRTGLPEDMEAGGVRAPAAGTGSADEGADDQAYRVALRQAIDARRLFAGVWLGTAVLSWVFAVGEPVAAGIGRVVAVNTVVALAALAARWYLPSLPAATTLDALAYRTIAFAFPIWTFAVIAGAIWAEQSWGRYWGWDPKETSAFLTWVAYAGYLHARATRGMRGRGAGWIGVAAFAVLMFTYYAVNLVVTGLHSYAGL